MRERDREREGERQGETEIQRDRQACRQARLSCTILVGYGLTYRSCDNTMHRCGSNRCGSSLRAYYDHVKPNRRLSMVATDTDTDTDTGTDPGLTLWIPNLIYPRRASEISKIWQCERPTSAAPSVARIPTPCTPHPLPCNLRPTFCAVPPRELCSQSSVLCLD